MEKNIEITKDERLDNIGFGELRLIQRPEEFCYGVDAVILADFVVSLSKSDKGLKALDLGTGTGVIPIILSEIGGFEEIIGVEIQENSYKGALKNVRLNKMDHKIRIINEDVKLLKGSKEYFDVVVSNPPYIKMGSGVRNNNEALTIARHETTATLEDFIKVGAYSLKSTGSFYLVHRPSRLVDIFCLFRKYLIEPKTIRLVSPNMNEKPNILLIQGVNNGKPELNIMKPLYIYDEENRYTEEINKIYRR